jgi:uncharacterized membrane protein YdfJ with MMPL/SSD domain
MPDTSPDSRLLTSRTLAARAARWSVRHRRAAIGGWLAFVVLAFAIGGVVGTKEPTDDGGPGDSARAERIIDEAFPDVEQELVLVQGRDSRSPEVKSAVAAIVATLRDERGVRAIRSPYEPGNAEQRSKDGRSVLVQFELRGEHDIDGIAAAVRAAARHHPSVRVGQFGSESADAALDEAFADDFKRAELLSVPLTLGILIVAFGALIAAGVPVLLALSAVAATLGLLSLPSQLVPFDENLSSIVLLVGMAVGVDYSLFYLRREREERRRGRDAGAAIGIAAATSGRAVLMSGFTVMVAMAGLLLAGDRTFTSLGIGAMAVVAVAMLGSITVLPAVLSALGDRIDKGRLPLIGYRPEGTESRFWGRVTDRVLARPLVSALAAAGVLVVLAIPAFSMQLGEAGVDGLPRSFAIMRTYDRIQTAFPGGQVPAIVVVKADDVRSRDVQDGIERLRRQAVAGGQMFEPVEVDVSPDGTVAIVSLPAAGNGSDAASRAAVEALRGRIVPATLGRVAGVAAYVGGQAADTKDFNDLMARRMPIVAAFVLGLTFLLLLVMFRSIVVPLKAIVLNLLSVGASYGVLVGVFQEGHGERILGFESTGTVTSWLPLFLFVILFGLSMDYHVFIISRVREAVDAGMRTDDAVRSAIAKTAGVVTSAAAVMVAVFAVFITLTAIDFKMMGVGLAVAILIDATIVRAVLLPATMKLLGRWNWYLPERLAWLPRPPQGPLPQPNDAT